MVQGLGAASELGMGRALTRAPTTFKEMPLVMSWISLGENMAPSLAPTLGGFLGEWAGWRATTFWFVGGFVTLLLPGRGDGACRRPTSIAAILDLGSLLRGSGEMLCERQFLGNVLTLGFAFAINFGMLAGVPFILQDHLGFSPQEFGLIVLLSVAASLPARSPTTGWSAGSRRSSSAGVGLVPCGALVGHGRPFAERHRHLVGDHRSRTWC